MSATGRGKAEHQPVLVCLFQVICDPVSKISCECELGTRCLEMCVHGMDVLHWMIKVSLMLSYPASQIVQWFEFTQPRARMFKILCLLPTNEYGPNRVSNNECLCPVKNEIFSISPLEKATTYFSFGPCPMPAALPLPSSFNSDRFLCKFRSSITLT